MYIQCNMQLVYLFLFLKMRRRYGSHLSRLSWDSPGFMVFKKPFQVSRKVRFGSQMSRVFASRNNTNISILLLWEKHL